MSGEQQDNNPESKLDHSYCSTLKGEYLIHSQLFPSLLYCITVRQRFHQFWQRGRLPSNIVTGLTQPGPRSAGCGCVRLASYWLWGFILILLNLPDCDLQIRGGHKMSGHLVMTFAATLWGETGGVLPVSPGTHQKMCWVEKKEWESRKKVLLCFSLVQMQLSVVRWQHLISSLYKSEHKPAARHTAHTHRNTHICH